MSSKRKLPSLGLERRVRPRREEEWEPEADVEESASDDEVSEEEIGRDNGRSVGAEEEPSSSEDESESEVSAKDATATAAIASISFGALARAQATLPPLERKNKRRKDDSTAAITASADVPSRISKAKTQSLKPQRSSKHAPQEQTSKRPVTRRREILADTRVKSRDPRFEFVSGGGPIDEARANKAYAFLEEYRESEMADLRAQIKKTKDAATKEDLKRQLLSMLSRKKARLQKEEEERVLAEHRKQEKELVAQGKQPFYLKKSEQKKRLLMDRFAGMSKGQVDKAIERRRKKVSSKEKKELDSLQRVRS